MDITSMEYKPSLYYVKNNILLTPQTKLPDPTEPAFYISKLHNRIYYTKLQSKFFALISITGLSYPMIKSLNLHRRIYMSDLQLVFVVKLPFPSYVVNPNNIPRTESEYTVRDLESNKVKVRAAVTSYDIIHNAELDSRYTVKDIEFSDDEKKYLIKRVGVNPTRVIYFETSRVKGVCIQRKITSSMYYNIVCSKNLFEKEVMPIDISS